MRLHVGCRAGQLGIATHDLFVLVRSRCARRSPGRPYDIYAVSRTNDPPAE